MAIQQLPPSQLQQYRQQRSQAGTQLLQQRAQNQYNRELQDLSFQNQGRKFATQWGRMREQLPMQYLQRGIFNSGIYQGALQEYAQDRLQAYQDLNLAHLLAQQGLTFQDRSAEDAYFQAMASSYGGQYADRAQLAATLRGIL